MLSKLHAQESWPFRKKTAANKIVSFKKKIVDDLDQGQNRLTVQRAFKIAVITFSKIKKKKKDETKPELWLLMFF